jgi:hypothetical protein
MAAGRRILISLVRGGFVAQSLHYEVQPESEKKRDRRRLAARAVMTRGRG